MEARVAPMEAQVVPTGAQAGPAEAQVVPYEAQVGPSGGPVPGPRCPRSNGGGPVPGPMQVGLSQVQAHDSSNHSTSLNKIKLKQLRQTYFEMNR